MDLHNQMIFDEYLENKEMFEKMRGIALDTLKKIIDDSGLIVAALEGRVKAPDSLEGKLKLKGYKYNSLYDITDILGCRVVVFYNDDVDKIASIMENTFIIDWDNSVDKRKQFELNEFGYMSLHYICQIPESLYKDPEYPGINHYKFEIQMRTTLQHVWATAQHDTGYKSVIEMPKTYMRRLNRLAGLLELADEEFNGIMNDIGEYKKKVMSCVKEGKFEDLPLDGETFNSYLKVGTFNELNHKIANIIGADVFETNALPYLKVFDKFGFTKLKEVDDMFREYNDTAYQLAARTLAGKEIDIVASTIGLRNLCIVYILKNGLGKAGLRMMHQNLFENDSKSASFAERTYKEAIRFGIIKGDE